MALQLPSLKETASQTAGPYVHIGLIPDVVGIDVYARYFGAALVGPDTPGERIAIEGRVLDGSGEPLREVLLEIWQADAAGRYPARESAPGEGGEPRYRGWGRSGSDFDTALYAFQTIKPGRVALADGGAAAPHINFWIVSRGINIGLNTRMYFSDEASANAVDPVLKMIEPKSRRQTLIARRTERAGKTVYIFDIRLQGEEETVFLDI
jgi:protocatechuate 3,4-dioxygenase, alpha subunit